MRVIAIDPGYDRIGFAILEKEKPGGGEILLYSNCYTTSREESFSLRLKALGEEMARLIKKYKPDTCALEKLYFTNNQKTAMAVSEARGVFLFLAAQSRLTLFEYTPLQIKNAVTGSGRSDKQQLATMVTKLIEIKKTIRYDDEYDAIAVGLTCLASER